MSPGRPLDSSRDAAILRATLEGLVELGYDRLSMDDIARRAHAGKGTLYRRWPSKAALVVDAIVAWRDQMAPIRVPDTGSLSGDMDALIAAVPDFDHAATRQLAVFVGVVGAAARDPELRAVLSDTLLERPRRLLREVLDHAVDRGEISPDRNLELVPDILIGLNLLKIMQWGAPDRDFVRRVVRDLILPLVTSDPSNAATSQ